MHLLLEVTAGPSAGKTIRLQPGQSIRIGRTDASEFPIPADTHISGRHFEIELTHHDCRIRDLRSTNGTLLNGQKIDQALLSNGDTISAGQTTIRVTITADVAAPVAPAEPGPLLDADATPQQRLLALFRTQFQPLFTILDSARDIKILALLMQSKEEHQSLYEGVEGAKLAQVAPYLVRLNKDSLLLGSLVLEGWGNSWGVFLTCDREFQDVRRHLRHFLEVQLPDGKQVYFRYYDPRVLRVFLPTCNADETNRFFGPIQYYLAEGDNPEILLRFVNRGSGADSNTIDLAHPERPPDKQHPEAQTQPRTMAFPQKAITDPNAR